MEGGDRMSGDTPCGLEAIWTCPFCGKDVWNAEVTALEIREADREPINCLILQIECGDVVDEDLHYKSSAEFTCPAMIECGSYMLHIYPDGHCHAYYY